MPLGAFRLNGLARYIVAGAAPGRPITIIPQGDAQVDTAQSKFGGASALFDGTGDGLLTGSVIDLSSGAWTIEAYVRPSSNLATEILFDPRITSGYLSRILGTRSGKIAYYNGSWQVGTTTMSLNTWYHLTWCYDGSNVKLFVNGNLENTISEAGTFSDTAIAIASRFDFGAFGYVGHIDELRMSNTARYTASFTAPTAPFVNDDDTLLLLHMDGTDGSTVFEDDTSVSTSTQTSLRLDGTGDYIRISDSSLFDFSSSDPWTIELWGRRDASNTHSFFDMRNTSVGTSDDGFSAAFTGTGTLSGIALRHASATVCSFPNGASYNQAILNTWIHYAFTHDGSGNYAIYIDGTQAATGSGSYASDVEYIEFGWAVGRNAVSDWQGWMDEIRISNTCRYTTSFTPATTYFENDANTILLLHMNGTDGSTTITDSSSNNLTVTVGDGAQIDDAQYKF